jgi:hypothetical protein
MILNVRKIDWFAIERLQFWCELDCDCIANQRILNTLQIEYLGNKELLQMYLLHI